MNEREQIDNRIESNANEVMYSHWKHVWIICSDAASYFENVVAHAWADVRLERPAPFFHKNAKRFLRNARKTNE